MAGIVLGQRVDTVVTVQDEGYGTGLPTDWQTAPLNRRVPPSDVPLLCLLLKTRRCPPEDLAKRIEALESVQAADLLQYRNPSDGWSVFHYLACPTSDVKQYHSNQEIDDRHVCPYQCPPLRVCH